MEWSLRKSGEIHLYGTFDQIGGKKTDTVQMRYSDYLEKLPGDSMNLYWGSYKTYIWFKNAPLIVIGPHCNIKFKIILVIRAFLFICLYNFLGCMHIIGIIFFE